MKAYVIFTEQIKDQNRYAEYVNAVPQTIENSGGKILIVQDDPVILEGQWHGTRTVVLEFDSQTAAENWYNSPEYQSIIGKRQASADTNAIIANQFVLV